MEASNSTDLNKVNIVKLGACGGVGGTDFDMDMDLEGHAILVKLRIWYSDIIGKIQAGVMQKDNPEVQWLDAWGQAGWGRFYQLVEIDLQGYNLTKVEGTIAKVVYLSSYYQVISSIKLTTTNKDMKPVAYGSQNGKPFTLSAGDGELGKIIGFFGRADGVIDAIGVYTNQVDNKGVVKLGACGGVGGEDFDMDITAHPTPTMVKVWYAKDVIGKIQVTVVYKDDPEVHIFSWGKAELNREYETAEIDFQGHNMQKVEGTIDLVEGLQVITSITLTTTEDSNPTTFGTPTGKSFTLSGGSLGKIIAFFGRGGDVVDAIGVYVH